MVPPSSPDPGLHLPARKILLPPPLADKQAPCTAPLGYWWTLRCLQPVSSLSKGPFPHVVELPWSCYEPWSPASQQPGTSGWG
ncbi:hypothetical protein DSO57_1011114, partial [Entomophthora muscae]